MFRRIRERIDPRYTKVCLYAAATVLLTFVFLLILVNTQDFWRKLWAVFSAVLRPVVLGIVFWFLLLPLVDLIERLLTKKKPHPWARLTAVVLSYAVVILALAAIISLIIVTAYKSVSALNVATVVGWFDSVKGQFADLFEMAQKKFAEIGLSVDLIGKVASAIANGVANTVTGIMFGVIFSIYFLIDGSGIVEYWSRAFKLFAGDKASASLRSFVGDVKNVFSNYLRGQMLDSLLVGLECGVVLTIAGVPSASIVAVLGGIGNMVPYMATVLADAAVILVCLPGANWDKMIIGLLCVTVVMTIDGNIINPRLVGSKIKVHPLLVVAALIAGGVIGGFAGIIVAVPVAALVKLEFDKYLDKVEKRRAADAALVDKEAVGIQTKNKD